jgi:hypothetical protein
MRISKYLLPMLALIGNPAMAGSVSSGGGTTLNNSMNPWFLENVDTVNYCIDIDETSMGITRSEALRIVRDSIEYWKSEFSSAKNYRYGNRELEPYHQVRIATQEFQYESCQESTDLRFQLGTLTSDQIPLVESLGDIVGVAYRTSYDLARMKGKGFVYVAAQTGALRPTSHVFAEHPWGQCNGCILEGVLKHELGHVFGMSHVDGNTQDIMNHNFPAETTSRSFVKEVLSDPVSTARFWQILRAPYFNLDLDPLFIGNISGFEPKNVRDIFGLTPDESVVRMTKIPSSSHPGAYDYILQASDNTLQNWADLGKLCWTKSESFGSKHRVSVFIEDGQRVFTKLPSQYFYGMLKAYSKVSELELSGSFCSSRGTPTVPLMLKEGSDGKRYLSTITDGMINSEWFEDSWKLR